MAHDADTEWARSRVDVSRHTPEVIQDTVAEVMKTSLPAAWHNGVDILKITNNVATSLLGYQPHYWPGDDLQHAVERALRRLERAGLVVKIKRGAEYMTANGPTRNGGQYSLWVGKKTWDTWQVAGTALVAARKRDAEALDERQAKLRGWAEIQGVDVEFHGDRAYVDLDTLEAILVRLAE